MSRGFSGEFDHFNFHNAKTFFFLSRSSADNTIIENHWFFAKLTNSDSQKSIVFKANIADSITRKRFGESQSF